MSTMALTSKGGREPTTKMLVRINNEPAHLATLSRSWAQTLSQPTAHQKPSPTQSWSVDVDGKRALRPKNHGRSPHRLRDKGLQSSTHQHWRGLHVAGQHYFLAMAGSLGIILRPLLTAAARVAPNRVNNVLARAPATYEVVGQASGQYGDGNGKSAATVGPIVLSKDPARRRCRRC